MSGSTDPTTVGDEPLTVGAGLITLAARGLSVVLSRSADRYRHEVLITTDETRTVLASLEGTGDQAWPPSPPFQEPYTQPSGQGVNAALLVGRAGRSHWSACIELDRSQETVLFDIACRSPGPIDWLGSTYACVTGDAPTIGDEGRRLLLPPGLEVHILEGEAQVREEGGTRVLSIVPTWTASHASQTIRWRYRIGRAGGHGAKPPD